MGPISRSTGLEQAGQACPGCGGSGVLRTAAAAHRTCLDCVGTGRVLQFEQPGFLRQVGLAAERPAADRLLGDRRREPGRWRGGFRGDVSAWTSDAR